MFSRKFVYYFSKWKLSHFSLLAITLAFLFIHSFPDSFINLTIVAEGIKAENMPAWRVSVTAVAIWAGHWN